MNEYHELNRREWNKRTDPHFERGYRVNEFIAGATSLKNVELKEIGDLVKGKRLLHLQCHFGMDTLSWARFGADVTGIDISDRSIERANELKEKTSLKARFIRTDLFDLPDVLDETFDIVYTSIGAVWWMSDIDKWAQVVAQYVKKGGFFYLMEDHPYLQMLDADRNFVEPYFNQGKEFYDDAEDYCVKELILEEYGWRWTLGDIITALCKAGLRIEYLHEFPFALYDVWPTMVKDDDGWRYAESKIDMPLSYTIKAVK